MSRNSIVAWLGLSIVLGAYAAGQMMPPPADGSDSAPLTLAPPRPDPVSPMNIEDSPLAPIRGNQSLSTNALLGFVNAEPVFVQDVIRPIRSDLKRLADTSKDLSAFRTAASKLIESQLRRYEDEIMIVSAAKAALTEDNNRSVDAYVAKQRAELITSYGGSEPLAEKKLREEGSSIDQLMQDRRHDIIQSFYLSKELSPRIVVTRQMILDEYKRDLKRWQLPAALELYTLSLPVQRWLPHQAKDNGEVGALLANPNAADVQAAQTKALAMGKEIVEKLKKGDDFAKLVEDYNSRDLMAQSGGRQANVKKDSIGDPKLADFVFSLPANTIGEPLLLADSDPTRSLVVVVKIGDKKEARTIPFEEAQSTIDKELATKQRIELTGKLQDKLMRTSAKDGELRNPDAAIQTAVQIAVTLYAAK